MNAFLAAVEALLADSRRVEALLALEKRRRGVAPDRLGFIGASNVASVRWCAEKAVLKSRQRSRCSSRPAYDLLGLPELPATDRGLLDAGSAAPEYPPRSADRGRLRLALPTGKPRPNAEMRTPG
jgi:hypothetical protein